MKQDVKITIITVSYNAVRTIEQTIQSVVRQSYKNIEYILIDGASTDGTLEVIRKYKDKLILVSEPDDGIYDAMNKGISYANGDYILFLGADDWLIDESVIMRVAPKLFDNDIIIGTVLSVNEDVGLQHREKNVFSLADVYSGYHPPHQGMFVRTEIMKKYKFNSKYRIVADYNFFLKCYFLKDIKITSINQEIAYYSLSGVSNNNKSLVISEDCSAMIENGVPQAYVDIYQKKCRGQHDDIKQQIKKVCFHLGILRQILLYKGWQKHQCLWELCRVCRRRS